MAHPNSLDGDIVRKRIRAVHGPSIRLLGTYVPKMNKFTCTICNTKWIANIHNVLHKNNPTGCPTCNSKSSLNGHTPEQAIRRLFGNKVIVDSPYVNAKTKMTFKCHNGHVYNTYLRYVLKAGKQGNNGCAECMRATLSKKFRRDSGEWEDMLKLKHPGYRWDKSKYVNRQAKQTFTCDKGHSFVSTIGHVCCTEEPCRQCPSKRSRRLFARSYSNVQIECIEAISRKTRLVFRHALNQGEYRVPGTRKTVDGYNSLFDIAIEFHGSFFHGEKDKRTKRYINTVNRDAALAMKFTSYIVIWEQEWLKSREDTIARVLREISEVRTSYRQYGG